MDNVYIKKQDLPNFLQKYFDKELITIDDLLGTIEELDGEIDHLEEKIRDVKNALHREGLDYLGW